MASKELKNGANKQKLVPNVVLGIFFLDSSFLWKQFPFYFIPSLSIISQA